MNKSDKRYYANFLETYGGLDLYDEDVKKKYTIDNKDIQFFKKKGLALVGIPDKSDVGSTDHEFFSIHEYLFDRILAMHQNGYI